MSVVEKQIVWYHISSLGYAGYLVWEIRDVIDGEEQHYYLKTLDNNHIYVACMHIFTEAELTHFLTTDTYADYELRIVMGEEIVCPLCGCGRMGHNALGCMVHDKCNVTYMDPMWKKGKTE